MFQKLIFVCGADRRCRRKKFRILAKKSVFHIKKFHFLQDFRGWLQNFRPQSPQLSATEGGIPSENKSNSSQRKTQCHLAYFAEGIGAVLTRGKMAASVRETENTGLVAVHTSETQHHCWNLHFMLGNLRVASACCIVPPAYGPV